MHGGQRSGRPGADHVEATPRARCFHEHLAKLIVEHAGTVEGDAGEQLAAALNELRAEGDVNGGTVARILAGTWNPRLSSLLEFADALGIDASHLVACDEGTESQVLACLRSLDDRRDLELLLDALSGKDPELLGVLRSMRNGQRAQHVALARGLSLVSRARSKP